VAARHIYLEDPKVSDMSVSARSFITWSHCNIVKAKRRFCDNCRINGNTEVSSNRGRNVRIADNTGTTLTMCDSARWPSVKSKPSDSRQSGQNACH
jgi:hypothetical protein